VADSSRFLLKVLGPAFVLRRIRAMNPGTSEPAVFASVAKRVQTRVALRKWLAVLRMTLLPASLVIALMVLAVIRSKAGAWLPWAGIMGWLAGALGYAWWRRPGEFSALALWDEVTGRREAFASAWWFECQNVHATASKEHWRAQCLQLPQALPRLGRDLPLRPDRRIAAPLLLAILGSFISVVSMPSSDQLLVDDDMARLAAAEAKKLAQTAWEKKKLAGLDENEASQVDDLKQKLQQTSDALASAGGKDARSVLSELERRARDAEQLAEKLGGGGEPWASDQMVQELRRHADTADLGDSVAAKNANSAAEAARALADKLKSSSLDAEAQQRLSDALKDVGTQSDAEDRKRMVGSNVLSAGDQMQQGRPAEAGGEFEKLADKLRDMAMREQARQELQGLAQQLRQAGSSIAGQNQESGAMQQMSQAGQAGQEGQQSGTPQVGQAVSGQSAQQMLNPPGLGQGQNQMQQPQGGPGQGTQQQMLSMAAGQPGQNGQQGQLSNGQPMLMAPVPGGKKPDGNSSMVILPPDQDQGNNDGSVAIAMPGGRQPGAGKAELNNTPTDKIESGAQRMVQGQQNNEGQSTVRSVQGGPRTENAARSASQAALDAIQAEESALDEAALPPARREQIRRYFNELRRRFESK
jgi:hypothetical protein